MIYSYLDKNVKISTVKSAYVAGLIGTIRIKGDLFQVDDVSDITETGIYNLRISAGIYAGFMLVIKFQNTITQIAVGLDFQNGYIRKMRCTEVWTTNFLDWSVF